MSKSNPELLQSLKYLWSGKSIRAQWVDLLRYPLATEKASSPFLNNTYTFVVTPQATKSMIKEAFEYVLNVKVLSVNTLMMPKKIKRRRQFEGYRPGYKKAVIKLSPQYTLDFFGMEKTSLGL